MAWNGTVDWNTKSAPAAVDFNTYFSENQQHLYDNRFDVTTYGVLPRQGTPAALNCTGTYADISGGSQTLNKIGNWLVYAVFPFRSSIAGGATFEGRLLVAGAVQPGTAVCTVPTDTEVPNALTWLCTTAGTTDVAKIQARSTNGGTVNLGTFVAHCWEA